MHLADARRDRGARADAPGARLPSPSDRQGGIVWMALAMMVKTRLWLAGEVRAQRDMPLIRQLIERVRRWAAHRPLLVCTDGLCSYIRAMRATLRAPVPTGTQGRHRLRPWRNICIAQVVKRYAQRRVGAVERRIVDGLPARVETRRRRARGWSDQQRLQRAMQRDLSRAPGIADPPQPGLCTLHGDRAARDVSDRHSL